jgi:hypothetical protein
MLEEAGLEHVQLRATAKVTLAGDYYQTVRHAWGRRATFRDP